MPAGVPVAGGVAGALIAIAGPIGLVGVAVGGGHRRGHGAIADSGFKEKDMQTVASSCRTAGRS